MLKHRLISGCVVGGAFLLAAAFVPVAGAWIVLLCLSCLAQLEFYAMMTRAGIPSYRIIGVICGCALISATFWTLGPADVQAARAYEFENAALLGTLLAIFVRQFPQKHNDKPLPTIGCTLLGIWYVPYMLNYFTRLITVWDGARGGHISMTARLCVLYLVAVVKCSDIGAFFVGRHFGRHKLFPRISPNKTWEGFVGANLAAVGAGCLIYVLSDGHFGKLQMPLGHVIASSLLLAWAGVVGDLFESLLKRAAGVKDSGALFPGMGGILDVLDSLLFGAPLLYVYLRVFVA